MDTLKINVGSISLKVVDDNNNERGVFTFNPNDIVTANKFFSLMQEIDTKQEEFTQKELQIKDEDTKGKLDLVCEVIDYFEDKIDEIFGDGTSNLLFGNNKTIDMFNDFFDGIAPYYEKVSKQRMDKYTKKYKNK